MSLATSGFHVASPPTTGGVRLNQVLCSTFQVAPSSSSSACSIQKNPGDDDVAPAPAPVSAASANNSNSYHHPPVNSVHAPPINSAHVNSMKVGTETDRQKCARLEEC